MWKNFLSGVLGGGIGAFIALQIGPLLWWVGLIIGGFIGYFSHEPRDVMSAFKAAGRSIFGFNYVPAGKKVLDGFWREAVLIATITIGMFPLFYFGIAPTGIEVEKLVVSFIAAYFISIFTFGLAMGILMREEISYKWNPVYVYGYYLPYYSLRSVAWFLKRIPRFLKAFFYLIHTQIRLMRMTGCFAGALLGYYFGSVLIGALMGGFAVVLLVEIVSKRILKIEVT